MRQWTLRASGHVTAWLASVLLFAGATSAPSQQPPESPYGKAQRLLLAGRHAEALPLLRAHHEQSATPIVKFQLGLCLYETFQYAAAEPLVAAAVAARPQREFWQWTLARIRMGLRRPRAALEPLAAAIALNPQPRYLYTQGICRVRADLPDEALASFRRCVLQDPANHQAFYELGRLLLDRGADAEAIAPLRRAVALDPEFANARFQLGLAELKTGRPEAAVAEFERVLEKVPGHVGAAHNLPRALQRLPARRHEAKRRLEEFKEISKLHERIDFCLAVVGREPDVPGARYNLVDVLLKAGYVDRALEHARAAATLAPTEPAALTRLAECLERSGRRDEAAPIRRQLAAPGGR